MKEVQLDMFESIVTETEESPAASKPKPVRRGRKKRKSVAKAPMLVDAYDASEDHGKVESMVEEKARNKGPHVYTVGEITGNIKEILEGSFPDLWLTGEVTDFKNKTGRHFYFSLKDESKNKIRSVIFNAQSRRLPFDLEDGLEVLCHGSLNVYGPGGSYSIIIDRIEPKGIGALQLAFEQLKKKLEAEGLFRDDRKKPLPFLPRKIGVVTSPTGAAIRDIINVLTRRFPNVEILVSPAKVQGIGAAEEIANAIDMLNKRDDVDLLIVGRGGGSMEDLWSFNEEIVARSIAASIIPVISAVGHEIDFTIADFVADRRAPTPSAAAEIAVPVRDELIANLQERKIKLTNSLRQLVIMKGKELQGIAARIRDPGKKLPDYMRGVDQLKERLIFVARTAFDKRGQMLSGLASNLEHLSPLGVLAKGYSVVEGRNGRVIKSARMLNIGDAIHIRFDEGGAEASITHVNAPKGNRRK